MKNNQKGFTLILIIAIIFFAAVAGYFFFVQRGNITTTPSNTANTQYQQQYQQANQNVPAIQTNSDLNTAANDLDNTDTSQIDTQLNQLSSDASTF
ncbi:MAG: hypothetical protein NT052_01315 [Candidatus Shapirobacteria bacterium]|nr:hypothetical protein [Candidatus Shapirobacteria bacterium]